MIIIGLDGNFPHFLLQNFIDKCQKVIQQQ